jgi:hypothetical protein
MKLSVPFLKSKKEKSDYYLSLILTDEKVGAVILKAAENTIKKVNSHETYFPDSLDELSLDDLINSIDKAISRAEEVLPPHIQTHQTIFGVKDNWVDPQTKKIKKEYLDTLKKVCSALDLTPLGFMVTTEAIIHRMQEEEGAPVSAVFAEIGKKYITLNLLRGGKVLESVNSPHVDSAAVTVDKLLGHFTVPVLPARIVIFQSKPDERTQHVFIAHQWSKSLPFLHMPQVTLLPAAFDTRSIIHGAASQMGLSVIEDTKENLPKVTSDYVGGENAEETEEAVSESETAITEESPADFGEEVGEGETESAAGDFGFVLDQDIGNSQAPETLDEDAGLPGQTSSVDEIPDETGEDVYESPRKRRSGAGRQMPVVKSLSSPAFIKKIMPVVSGIVSQFQGKKTALKFIVPVFAIIIIVIGVVWFYFYKMHATVLLTLKENAVSQDETVTFSTTQPDDFNNNLIAAKSISASINGQVSTNATGSKDIGDKAKGTVTIYNNNSNSVTLPSGATLTAGNGQVFLLDNSVTVASASGDIFSGTTPGTKDTTVTAQSIGTDGNEPSGTEFKIGSDNTVAAKNDNAFTGGTKKTVTVVSENDIAKLREELPQSVASSAKQKLTQQADSGYTVLPLAGSATLEDQQFSHNVNDQATQVSLTATVVYSGMEYSNSDMDSFAKTIMKQKYPQDPDVANNSINENVTDVSQKSTGTANATVAIQAGLLPNINQQDVISSIKNESLGQAKNTLTNLPQVQNADITFSPPIPFLPLLFPRLPKHISVTMTSQ